MKRKDCFAYDDKKQKCHCLIELGCTNCSFYKNYKEIKDNPFYGFSYKDKNKLERDMKKGLINESQVLWR